MDPETLAAFEKLGVVSGVVVGFLIVKEVLSFVLKVTEDRRKKPSSPSGAVSLLDVKNVLEHLDDRTASLEESMSLVCQRTQDLHNWHNVRDAGGTLVWYVRASLESSIERLAISLDASTNVLERVVLMLNDVRSTTNDTKERVMELQRRRDA